VEALEEALDDELGAEIKAFDLINYFWLQVLFN
jgi:hypothetical protein